MFNRNRDDLPTIRITSLSTDADEDDLRRLFDRFGRIVRANVVRDRDTQESKGFAFVSFDDRSSGEKAIQAMDGRGESTNRLAYT
jgi:translation initiation factor 3 subunit G